MTASTPNELVKKRCVPCEGGVPPLEANEVEKIVKSMPCWRVTEDGQRIRREWITKNFVEAINFFNKVAQLAEAEGHHPDLHLVGYRNVAIEVWTHAIGGLSENDFILAAKIDLIPVQVRK